MCLDTAPCSSLLTLKTHFSPIARRPGGRSASDQVLLSSIASISSIIAFLQLGQRSASANEAGSSGLTACSSSISSARGANPSGDVGPRMFSIFRNRSGASSSWSASRLSSPPAGGEANSTACAPPEPPDASPAAACGDGGGVVSPSAGASQGASTAPSAAVGGPWPTMEYSTVNTSSSPSATLELLLAAQSHWACSSKTTSRVTWTLLVMGS